MSRSADHVVQVGESSMGVQGRELIRSRQASSLAQDRVRLGSLSRGEEILMDSQEGHVQEQKYPKSNSKPANPKYMDHMQQLPTTIIQQTYKHTRRIQEEFI